ncbi:hypothetical protein ACI2LF_17585 [Kribbella sp. NPDC020789]
MRTQAITAVPALAPVRCGLHHGPRHELSAVAVTPAGLRTGD